MSDETLQRKLLVLDHQHKRHIAEAERLEGYAKHEPQRTLDRARAERERAQLVLEHMAMLEQADG